MLLSILTLATLAPLSTFIEPSAQLEKGSTLTQVAPDVANQIKRDSKANGLFELWGESLNFDEFAKAPIVSQAVLDEIAQLAATPVVLGKTSDGKQIVHAGLEHTYGYLFSTLSTPYGFKRERWTAGKIEQGLGLQSNALHPDRNRTGQSTLLTNVTYVLGSIAFRNDPNELSKTKSFVSRVHPSLRGFSDRGYKIRRLEERIERSGSAPLIIRTDFVEFRPKTNGALLVYSVRDEKKKRATLVTGFPVNAEFVAGAFDRKMLGPKQLIQTRYNLWLGSFSEKPTPGIRKEVE